MAASDENSPRGKARADAGLATAAAEAAHAPTLDSDPRGLAATMQSDPGAAAAVPGSLPTVIAERYRVGKQLGRGGFGAVYEAVDQRIDKRVAVKILDEQRARTDAGIKQFRAEALAASRLRHPGIIAVTDYDLLPDGRPFLVMEFATGETLEAVLRRAPLPADRAVKIAEELAAALEVAHRAGVIHRDLKPGNIMIEDGAPVPVKILDFGIAKIADSSQSGHVTDASSMIGTPHYMAPEQIRDQHGKIGPHTDVYALGAVVFEMIAGRPPFAHITNIAELLLAQLGDPPPPLEGAPAPVAAAVMRALEKDPARRFGSARDFADELRGEVVAPPAPPTPPRSRARLAAALGGLVLAGGAAAAYVATRSDGDGVAVIAPDAAAIAAPIAAAEPSADAGLDWRGPWQDGVSDEQKQEAMLSFQMGNLLLEDERWDAALIEFRRALASWDHPAIHFNAATCLVRLERWSEASEEIELALKYGGAGLEAEAFKDARKYQQTLRDRLAADGDAGVAAAKKPPKKAPKKRGSDEGDLPDSPRTKIEAPK